MTPTAKLRAEYTCGNPPKLLGFHVIVDGKTIAVIPADEVERFTARSENVEPFERFGSAP
jgi:hypothetical protein